MLPCNKFYGTGKVVNKNNKSICMDSSQLPLMFKGPPATTETAGGAEVDLAEVDLPVDPGVDDALVPIGTSTVAELALSVSVNGPPITAESDGEANMQLHMSVEEVDLSQEEDHSVGVTGTACLQPLGRDSVASVEANVDGDSDTDIGYYERETQANETVLTAKKNVRVRRKVRCEAEWKRNVRKRLRNSGKSYISSSGKAVLQRQMGKGCSDKCRYKCKEHITEENRTKLFNSYWQTGDINHQRQFIVDHINRRVTARPTKNVADSRRQLSFSYQLSSDCDNTTYTVCKTFFLDTLGVKEDVVYGAFDKTHGGGVVEPDRRGKHRKHRTVSAEAKKSIKEHIRSFKTIESHYCRKSSERKYLPAELNVTKMYNMYKEVCARTNLPVEKESVYRKIFNREFNLHFYVPKKDQCDFCTEYRHTVHKTPALEREYKQHCDQKLLARQAKQVAKDTAKANGTYMAACFDLEKVLNCPHAEASSFYYHRKLSLYNLTCYCLGSGSAYCYLWNETQAKRGCNEIASCLLKFLDSQVKQKFTSFTFFSDNCSGQNRNRYIATLWWYAVRMYDIDSIVHNFLEVGHTQNENDSVHSSIERVSRRASIYTPDQWSAVISTARADKPYIVTDMQMEDFCDFKEMSNCVRNFGVDEDGNTVKWTKICSMEFTKKEPDTMHFRYLYDQDPPKKCLKLMKRARHTRQSIQSMPLRQLRSTYIPLSVAKFNDLRKLCDKELIPQHHHGFFRGLPHEENV